jgi:hypothetical protein
MPGERLKINFLRDVKNTVAPTHLVVAVKLPTGATEIIANNLMLAEKITYYTEMYDENFALKHNSSVKVIGYMLV